ncbi:Cytosol aminopeptidase, catalytic domain [Borealophlyctis nickersoniae]|nr:Cytosol aminopeptidase, catalytic domain [Borealophlyctis nickersoniae]
MATTIPRLTPILSSALASTLAQKHSYDALLVVYSKLAHVTGQAALSAYAPTITSHSKVDASLGSTVSLIPTPDAPGGRLILSPTGNLLGDSDDVRRFADAARKAVRRSKAAGAKRPIVWFPDSAPEAIVAGKSGAAAARVARDYAKSVEVALLGVLAEVYEPLQTREHFDAKGEKAEAFEEIGVVVPGEDIVELVGAVDEGRRVAKDVGGSDCERMTPLRSAEYIEAAFKGSDVKVSVTRDVEVIKKEYPLLHAVTRASLAVPRHHPTVVRLEYHAPDQSQVKENIFLVGKGVTYDTGGLDIKAGGVMRGMSRDKCGAAACAGFLKAVSILKPKHVNVIADLGFVRNSVGPDGYVSDEIIYSRAGVRVLVGNTDAEGRMVMCDLLAAAKERALSPTYASTPSRILTVATLTGHAVRAVGCGYSVALDNGPAREDGVAQRLLASGNVWGDPFELSTLRREDYEFVAPGASTEDVVQANDKPSTQTSRGHQYPAAFLSVASGIAKHGLDSDHPISFTHCDIAGSAEEGGCGLSLPNVTGSPVAAFVGAFLM